MTALDSLRDAYHDLEAALDARAAAFADARAAATRAALGEVCLTAQRWSAPADARFDFRDPAPTAGPRYAELRPERRAGTLVIAFRADGAADFDDAYPWGHFDTLSKLLILEGLDTATGTCG